MIRTAWFILNAVVVTPILSLVVIAGSLTGAREPLYDRIGRFWVGWLLRVSGVRVEARGLANIATAQAQLLLSNHVSFFDVLALSHIVPKRYRFVGKQELTRVPFWGRAWQAAGHVAIDRTDTQRAIKSLDRVAQLTREDQRSIVMFPEGTRSATGELQPFKKGPFMLALHTGVPIVPVAVTGSRSILPKGSWRVRSGRIIVRFGHPIDTTRYDAGSRDELMARVHTELAALLAGTGPEPDNDNVDHR
ncbi:MAG TPA: lysophospholipid acyltransferase family protein [Longimicrobiales bacterium]|nr:lysophospholipid acyltransferase family protein [Longimicrobiales bacterium]